MTKYTDDQINEAIMLANQTGKVYVWETEMYRNVINHLPEPGKTYITNVGIQQQIGRLQDLTSSENEAVMWLSTLNHLVATGADRKRILRQDTQDDWQECKFADIRKGDRVRWEVPASEDKESYEIIVRHLSEEPRVLYSNTGSYHFPDGVILYRIQAPVTPPDPAEHPVIIVHKELAYDFTQTPDGGQAMMWNGDTYENADYEFFCKDITDWTPAKVTPLED